MFNISFPHIRLAYFLVIAYVFDEILNWALPNNISGAFALIALALIALLTKSNQLKLSIYDFALIFIVFFFSGLAFLSGQGCNLEAKGLLSLTLLLFLVLAMRIFPPSVLIVDDKLSRLLLASISGFLLLAAAKVSIYFYLYGWPRYSDPYSEPSHLALYLLPLIIYRLTGRLTDVWSWLAVALAMLFAPSTTLVIGLVLLLIVIVIQGGLSFKKAITIFFSVSLAYVLSQFDLFDTSHYTDRIRGVMQSGSPIYINTSSLIWLNGWSQAQESLVGTFGLGTGFNQMGCGRFAFSGIFSWQMLVGNGLLLNTENGSFTAAKIIAELGIAGVIIVFFLTILSVRSILKVRTVKIYDVSDTQGDLRNIVSRARATAGVCILIFLYIRNPGYFQLPLITALSLLFIRATDVIKMGHRSQSFNQMKEC